MPHLALLMNGNISSCSKMSLSSIKRTLSKRKKGLIRLTERSKEDEFTDNKSVVIYASAGVVRHGKQKNVEGFINKNKNVSSLSNATLFRSVEQAETYINSSTVKEMYTKFHIINLTMELESISKSFSVGEHRDIISVYKELSSDKESIHAIMAKQKQKQIEKAIKIMQEEKQNNHIQKNTENNNLTYRKKRKL